MWSQGLDSNQRYTVLQTYCFRCRRPFQPTSRPKRGRLRVLRRASFGVVHRVAVSVAVRPSPPLPSWIPRRDPTITCAEGWCLALSSCAARIHGDMAPIEPTDLIVTSEVKGQADPAHPRRRRRSVAFRGGFRARAPGWRDPPTVVARVAVSVAVRRGIRPPDAASACQGDRPNLRIYSGIRGVLNLPLCLLLPRGWLRHRWATAQTAGERPADNSQEG